MSAYLPRNPDFPTVMNFQLNRIPVLALVAAGLFAATGATAQSAATGPELKLGEAIAAALDNNLSYQGAALDPLIARQFITQAEAAFDTELFASGRVAQTEQELSFEETTETSDNRFWQAGATKRLTYGTTITAQTNLDRRNSNTVINNAVINFSNLSQTADLALSVRQPLLSGFGKDANTAQIQSSMAGYTAASEAFRETLFQILATTERAYWTVARLQEQLALDESSLEVAETLVREAQERERVGVATRIDVLQAEAERARRNEDIIETRRLLGDASDQLLVLMGTFLPETGGAGESVVRVSALPEGGESFDDFAEIWNLAKAQDPLLAQQEAVITQREWEQRAADNSALPSLDLVMSGAYSGVDNEKASVAYDNALDRDGTAWAVGIEFSMPWRMRAEKAALRRAEKRLEQETIRYQELQQALFRDVRAAWRNLDSVGQSLEAAKLTVSLQQATFERELGKFEEGISVFRDVLEVQRDLDQARIRLLDSKYNKLSSEISIARLSGLILQRHGLDAGMLLPQTEAR